MSVEEEVRRSLLEIRLRLAELETVCTQNNLWNLHDVCDEGVAVIDRGLGRG